MRPMQHNDVGRYVQELGLEWHRGHGEVGDRIEIFIWPAAKNGTRFDRFVAIEEFSDGSAKMYLDATNAKALRKMTNPEE